MDMRLLAAEGALRENIFDNEEPSGGAGRFSGRGATAGGTYARCYFAESPLSNLNLKISLFFPKEIYQTTYLVTKKLSHDCNFQAW